MLTFEQLEPGNVSHLSWKMTGYKSVTKIVAESFCVYQLIISALIEKKKHIVSLAVLRMSQIVNPGQPISCSVAAQSGRNVLLRESKRLSAHRNVPVSILTTSDLVSLTETCTSSGLAPEVWPRHCDLHSLIYRSCCHPHLRTQIWRSLHVREWTPLLGWRFSVWLHRGSASRSGGWRQSLGAESWRDHS